MKRMYAIGIILLVFIALTGVVNAETAGKADLSGNVYIPPSLELTTSGSITNWVLEPDSLSFNGRTGVTITVTNNGYANGYHVSVADKLDPLHTGGIPKPAATAGHLSTYCFSPGDPPEYCGTGVLTNPVEIDDMDTYNTEGGSPPVHVYVSGADQKLYNYYHDLFGSSLTYTPTFEQIVGSSEKPAQYYGATGYRIILTFTATSN